MINVKDNKISESLDNINSFKSIMRHEVKHFDNFKSDIDDGTGISHAEVYLHQMQQTEFQKAPESFKVGIASGMIKSHLVPMLNDRKINGNSQVVDFINGNKSVFQSAGLNIQVSILPGSGEVDNIFVNGKKTY